MQPARWPTLYELAVIGIFIILLVVAIKTSFEHL